MLRRINFFSICVAFGFSVLSFLTGSRYADNTYCRSSYESRRNARTFSKVEDGVENFMQPVPPNSFDDVLTIENIIEKTRSKIKLESSNYNFSHSGVHSLEDLLIDSGGRPIRNVIVSTWRSGSTFLGEVLNAIPGTFYQYEPFLKYGTVQIRGLPYSNEAASDMKDMLKCNFEEMDDYFKYGKYHLHQFSHNTRLWDHCKYKKELCYDADFTSRFCKLFPFQSMKVVRLRLRFIKELLEDEQLNVKVVLLIRDPRGVMHSRQHRIFCLAAPDCWQPEPLCADMVSDYVAASRLLPQYSDRLMLLRYEELALNPKFEIHRILKFLRLSPTPSLDEYLQSHTNVEVEDVRSTFRVTREVPFRWKNALDFDYVDEIQAVCKEAMDLWGYRMAHNATHVASKDFNPIDSYTIRQ